MQSKFIVTGAAGFIGSNIVEALNKRGHEDIVVVDRLDDDAKKQNIDDLRYVDFVDKEDFRKQFLSGEREKVDCVFHMGACSSTTETNEAFLHDNNFMYTRQLCEWCLEHSIRFVYASSAATYGNGSLGYSDADAMTPRLKPLNLYGKSKQMFDEWALQAGHLSRIAGLKYFNVYGPREDHKGDMRSVVNKAYGQVLDSGEIRLFRSSRDDYKDGQQERDFVYVADAVAVTLFFYDHPEISGLFNCGTGRARTWVDLARAVFAAMDREPKIVFIDMPEAIREKYQYHTQAEIEKLRASGYDTHFTSIEDGVREYVRGYLSIR